MEVVCIGSGNVATHLAKAFKASGAKFVQVYSPNETHAAALAAELDSVYTNDLRQLYREADLYLIAVKDDAIPTVVATLTGIEGMVVHTSGATSITVLEAAGLSHYGVFYPLQTFSKTRAIDFERIPLCLEANHPENLQRLKQIAGKLSTMVYEVSGEQRKILHLSAVFACNFVNHLYDLGRGILQEHQLDFELLRPLILETAEKVQSALPIEVQTGPAVRGDQETMAKHLALLENRPDLQEIYKILSNGIKKTHI